MALHKDLKEYMRLPRSIIILFFARIVNSLGNFVYPFLTLFLSEKIGMSTNKVGSFMMIAAIASSVGSVVGGKLADVIGRKKVMLYSQGMAAVMLVPCGFLGYSMLIPWFIVLMQFFVGAVYPANSAMVADLTNKKNRQQAFSLLYLGINIGVAIGPLVAGVLYRNYLQWIFWGDALTTFISLILVGTLVKEAKHDGYNENLNENEKSETGSVVTVMLKRPALLAFSLVSMIYSFIYSQCNFSLPLQIKGIYPEEGSVLFGSLMSVNAIVVVACTVIIVGLTRRNKPILNVAIAGLFYAIGFGMLYFVNDYSFFIISTIIWTIGEILSATNQGVYIANNTPMSHRGRVNSVLPLISGIGNAMGPSIMGMYILNREIRMSWTLIFILALGAAFLMYILYLNEKKRHRIQKTPLKYN